MRIEGLGDWLRVAVAHVVVLGALVYATVWIKITSKWLNEHRTYVRARDQEWNKRIDEFNRTLKENNQILKDIRSHK